MSCTQFKSFLDKDNESKLGKVIKGVKSLSYEKWLFEEFDLVSSAKQKLREYDWSPQIHLSNTKNKAGINKICISHDWILAEIKKLSSWHRSDSFLYYYFKQSFL